MPQDELRIGTNQHVNRLPNTDMSVLAKKQREYNRSVAVFGRMTNTQCGTLCFFAEQDISVFE